MAVLCAAPASAADRAYTKRFGVNTTGDVSIVGNTSMSCAPSGWGWGPSCTDARAGSGNATYWNNDQWNMTYVDADSDSTTFSSSMATLDLPAGATVLFAGLYWGGDTSSSLRNEVKLDTPALGGYQDLTATTLDTSTATPTAYQGFHDVTSLVTAAGSGDYLVGNVQGTADQNMHAGWALVVAYRDPARPRQNISVFDGFQDVKDDDSHSATLTGLTTPASGTVDATVGVFAHEGDLGIEGDTLALNSSTLSNPLNPADNAFNSSITNRGVRFSDKQPDYVNQFSVEMDTFDADGIVPPGATSATVNMTSTQDRYYPGVITYAGEAETVPPVTTIDSGPSGFTNDPTPTYAFSSNEAGSTFECRVDADAWAPCTSPRTVASLTDGSHTFEVRAIDVAGNTDPTPASRTITVDTLNPDTTIDSGPSGATNDPTPTFGFSADQSGSSFQCRIDGGAWASCTSPRTTASLSDGAHTFDVRATDPAGNVDATPASRTFTVDTTAPNTTIDSGPTGTTNDSTPTFGFSASPAGGTFECRIDGGAWASCSSPRTVATLTDGSHTFDVRATDPAGNVDATPASRSFTVDTTAPNTTIDSGPTGTITDSTPTFGISASPAGGTLECRIDGGAWATCSTPHTTASLGDGSHTFEVRALDAVGNADPTPASRTFTVDTAAPQTTIDSGPSGPTSDATPSFTFSADQAGSTFECRVDGGAWASCTSPRTTASLSDGAHTFDVRATDPAGNVDATPASRTFTVDTGAPQTTIDSGASGPTSDATPSFAFSADQSGSTFECRVDGGAWASCSSPHTTAALSDGAHTFEVRATDAVGNVDPTPASRGFTVDTTAPQTTIDSGPSGPTTDATPAFGFSANQAGSTFECRVDGGAWASCSTPHTTTSLSDGSHTFYVRATDPAGNVDPTPASRGFSVDTTAPQTTIDSGPSGATIDATPAFGFSADQAGSIFECRVDGGAWASCSSPETTASLADGLHTFQVRATDPAGNVDPTPAARSFTVDTDSPQTTIDSGPSGPTSDPTPAFTFSAGEPGSTYECRVDGGAWSACTSPATTASLADGAHTFETRATDAAGNVDATPASRGFTVDTTAPQTTIASGPAGPTGDATPAFGFSADEPGSTYECRIDGGAWASCTQPHTTGTLADGSHTFAVRATDAVGNTDPTPASRTFTVDTTAPNTTIDSGPTGMTGDATPAFEFSASQPGSTYECRVDAGAWASCSSPRTTASLSDGPHTFQVRATDPAGNVDPTPASRTFTVDTTAPDTTIDSGPAGPTNDPTPAFGFSADQAGATYECRVDGGAWSSCSSPETTASLSAGSHTFQVRATDASGNVDTTPASRTFTVDTNAPDTTIDNGPVGVTNDSTPTFELSADEAGSTFECRIDGGAWATCTGPHTTGTLSNGPHTFEVRAIDSAGNADQSPASQSFTVTSASGGTPGGGGPGGGGPGGGGPGGGGPGGGGSGDGGPGGATPAGPGPATPAPVPSAPAEARSADLGALPGSLVGERSCQRLGAGLRTKRARVKGIGRVSVRIRASAIVMADDPLMVSVTGPRAGKGRLRSVGYKLNGRRMRGAGRKPFALAIKPAALARVGRHALALKLKPRRGRARTLNLGMRTFPCRTVFRAYQKRKGKGAQLKLRIDARDAVGGATFSVPGKMLPKGKSRMKVGKLRVISASSASRSWNLAFDAKPRSGLVLGSWGAPRVTVKGGKVTVTGLPAGTGIVELLLDTKKKTRPAALVRAGRTVGLRATVTGAASQRLSYKLRGRR